MGVILSYQAIVENRVPAGGPQQEALLLLAQAGGLNLGYEVIGLIGVIELGEGGLRPGGLILGDVRGRGVGIILQLIGKVALLIPETE